MGKYRKCYIPENAKFVLLCLANMEKGNLKIILWDNNGLFKHTPKMHSPAYPTCNFFRKRLKFGSLSLVYLFSNEPRPLVTIDFEFGWLQIKFRLA